MQNKIYLTDSMIIEDITSRRQMAAIIFTVVIFVMVITFVGIAISMGRKKKKEADEKRRKIYSKNQYGLLITSAIFVMMGIGVYFLMDATKLTEDNWHVEITTVSGKSYHYKRNKRNHEYGIYFYGYENKVKVGKSRFDAVVEGDSVYVIVKNSRSSHVEEFYPLNEYLYEGNKLSS